MAIPARRGDNVNNPGAVFLPKQAQREGVILLRRMDRAPTRAASGPRLSASRSHATGAATLLPPPECPLASPLSVPLEPGPSSELTGSSRGCPGPRGRRVTDAGAGLTLASVPRAWHRPGTEQSLNKSWLLFARGENGEAFVECNLAGPTHISAQLPSALASPLPGIWLVEALLHKRRKVWLQECQVAPLPSSKAPRGSHLPVDSTPQF